MHFIISHLFSDEFVPDLFHVNFSSFFFFKEKYKRALADTENLRQRSQKLVEEAKLYGNFKHYMILILGNMDKEVGVCVVLDSMVDQVGRWGGCWLRSSSC